MKKVLAICIGLLAVSCSTMSEEDEIVNCIMMNECDTNVELKSVEGEAKDRYCYPFAYFRIINKESYSVWDEKKEAVYNRFREDSIVGFPGTEGGVASKKVVYRIQSGQEKEIIIYFGRGNKPIATTLDFYKMCH